MKFDNLPSKKIRDVRGERFGRLLAESFSHTAPDKGKNAYWTCLCDCGNKTTVSSAALRTGTTKSCGCLASENSRKRIKELHTKGKHLYFIRCGDFVKIGRANNPVLRLGQIRASNPYGADLIKVYEDQGYREKELHECYRHLHHTGEWFRWTDGISEVR